MSTEPRHQTDYSDDNLTKAWYQAAVGTAVVAGLFSLIVSALLIFNYFQSRHPLPSLEGQSLPRSIGGVRGGPR